MRILNCANLMALSIACMPVLAAAQVIYNDGLTSTDGSGYNVNAAQSTNYTTTTNDGTSDATFGWDYSQVGVPLDPYFTGNTSTTALRIRAAISSTSYGGIAVAPAGFSLPTNGSGAFTPFKIQYDLYTNFVASGTNSTTLEDVGIGSGTTPVTIFNPGTLTFASTIDGGTGTTDYRAYVNSTDTLISDGLHPDWYGAYSVAHKTTTAILGNTYSDTSLVTGDTVAYYEDALTGGGSISAPAGQTGNLPSTTSGTTSYAWHMVDVSFDGTNYTWSIDGTIMAQIPASGITDAFSGDDFFIGGADTGKVGDGTDADAQLYNFILVDNLRVTAVPEPASLSMLGIGAVGLLARRRGRRAA